jgi:hypothetical protein
LGLERGPLSLVSIIEELLERKSSGSGVENRDYGLGISRADHAKPLFPQKLTITSPTSGGRSVDIVRSRTTVTKLFVMWSWVSTSMLEEEVVRLETVAAMDKNSKLFRKVMSWSWVDR